MLGVGRPDGCAPELGLGGEDFRDWLVDKSSKRSRTGVRASERFETDAVLAERLVTQRLAKLGWREVDLRTRPKRDWSKIKITHQLRTQTPMSYQWIADRLRMGSASYVFNLLYRCK